MAVKTIIFGPTGGVASFAVKYAASHGAHVVLAMRDTSKSISGLTSSEETPETFTRVKADLTDPASVSAAATETKAQSAFIYLVQGPEGTPTASIQALKDAGVKHVVFLSTWSIDGDPRNVEPADFIPFAHGQVEIALAEIFGEGNYTCVRPSWFASNSFRYIEQMKTGTVREIYPDNDADYIAPQDIGEVAASLLLRPTDEPIPSLVEVSGQQLVANSEALYKIAKAAGREIKVEHMDAEEGVRVMMERDHFPEPVARYLANQYVRQHNGYSLFSGSRWTNAQSTVKKMLGRDGITLDQWIEQNAQAFA